MKGWSLGVLAAASLVAATAWADRDVRLDLGLGASNVNGPVDAAATERVFTGLAALSLPAAGGLRTTAEVQTLRFTRAGGYRAIPEVQRLGVEPTGMLGVMLGMEWQPALAANWSPFVHASMGAARVSRGDEHWSDMNSGAFDIAGDTSTLPVWSAGVGVRGRPAGIGPALFADARYTWTDQHQGDRVKLTQVLAGVSF